jgi:hypothetical protein
MWGWWRRLRGTKEVGVRKSSREGWTCGRVNGFRAGVRGVRGPSEWPIGRGQSSRFIRNVSLGLDFLLVAFLVLCTEWYYGTF